jgi:hypothetical protein
MRSVNSAMTTAPRAAAAIAMDLVFRFTSAIVLAGGAAASGLAADSFRADFTALPEGPFAAPGWTVLRGEWRIRGGALVQSAEGENLAVAVDPRVGGSRRITARFRTVGGIPGEGILFGMKDAARLGGCHLVRVDPEGIYHGALDAAGELRGDGPVPALVEGGAWKTLVISVDAEAGTYSIALDGASVVEKVPLEHAGSGIGLASSWGVQEFASVEVAPLDARAAGNRAGGAGAEALRAIDIATSPGRPDAAVLLVRDARPLRVIAPGSSPVSLGRTLDGDRLAAAEIGPAGEAYVLDEEHGRIDRYPAESGPPGGDLARLDPAAEPRAIAASPPLDGPRGLAVFPDGRLVVAESRARRVAILSPAGERLAEVGSAGEGPGRHERPSDVAVDAAGRVIVADFKACRVTAFAPDAAGVFRLAARSPWLAPPGRLLAVGSSVAVLGRFAYYETGGAVRLLDRKLLPAGFLGFFAAGGISEEGGLAPGRAVGGAEGSAILCLSRKDGRIFRVPLASSLPEDVRPRVRRERNAGGEAATVVEWRPLGIPPAGPAPPRLQHRKEGEDAWKEVDVAARNGRFRAALAGLDGEAPHEFRFFPHHDVAALPGAGRGEEGVWSKPYRVFGPEPEGRKRYLELSVACAVYLAFEDPQSKSAFSLTRDKLGSKLEREYEVAREFFWRNSGMRLHVRADFEVIEGTPARVARGWIDPSQARRDLAPRLEARGRKLEDYDSVIAMWAEPGWRADLSDDLGSVGGGGLTSFAYSTYGIGGRAAWLFCHEYHHQIDAFFNRSGHLDYPLNHPDATVQPGRYGQHWDCNAFFLRGWGDEEWLWCKFGKVLLADDADADGVPDRNPRLPIDEARLGSDPSRPDTDGDGLTDLAEVMAGTFHETSPGNPDTDGDGVRDGADAAPRNGAFQGPPAVVKGSPAIDGRLEEGEWGPIGTVHEAGADVFARWDAVSLCFAVRSARPLRASFEIDAANDGWFLEDDNRIVELEVDGSASPRAHHAEGARTAGSGGAAAPVAEVAVPVAAIPALRLAAGSRLGLCVRVTYREGEGESARERELFLAEPWQLMPIELTE